MLKGRGLAAAIRTGGQARRMGGADKWALTVGCDMPFLDPRLLERLGALAADADLAIPRSARGYEPLCAVYGRACAPDIRHRIEHGDLQASVLPSGVRIAEIGPDALAALDPDGRLFENVNTPHDYARANDSGKSYHE